MVSLFGRGFESHQVHLQNAGRLNVSRPAFWFFTVQPQTAKEDDAGRQYEVGQHSSGSHSENK